MIGNPGTFWEYFFFGFVALGAALIHVIVEYWMQITVLALIIVIVKFVRGEKCNKQF